MSSPGGQVRGVWSRFKDHWAWVGVLWMVAIWLVGLTLLAVAIFVSQAPLLGRWQRPGRFVARCRKVGLHEVPGRQRVVIGESTGPLPKADLSAGHGVAGAAR